MSYFGYIQIKNKLGWTKTVDIKKTLCLIGSSPSNDVVLNEEIGGGIFPVHLQLICPRSSQGQYRLINLSSDAIQVFDGSLVAQGSILPRVPQEIQDRDMLKMGDFTLQFHFQTERGIVLERRTENIGVMLEMLGTQLKPGKILTGRLTLTNLGEEKRCQFVIELEGLPIHCYQIAPAPLLYPGATEELTFKLFHRGTQPPSGRQEVKILTSAAGTYPTELISIPLTLDVLPVHCYSLSIHEDENAIPDNVEAQIHEPALLAPAEITEEQENLPLMKYAAEPELAESAETKEEIDETTIDEALLEPVIPIEPVIGETELEQFSVPGVSSDGAHVVEPEEMHSVLQPEHPDPVEAEMEPEEEESWWVDETDIKASQAKANPLNALRKDIKSRLAEKDIQVIKAGSEVEETEEDSSTTIESSRDE